jgi:hypothetical protein
MMKCFKAPKISTDRNAMKLVVLLKYLSSNLVKLCFVMIELQTMSSVYCSGQRYLEPAGQVNSSNRM